MYLFSDTKVIRSKLKSPSSAQCCMLSIYRLAVYAFPIKYLYYAVYLKEIKKTIQSS